MTAGMPVSPQEGKPRIPHTRLAIARPEVGLTCGGKGGTGFSISPTLDGDMPEIKHRLPIPTTAHRGFDSPCPSAKHGP